MHKPAERNGKREGKAKEVRSWDPLTAAEVAAILKLPIRRIRQLGIPCVQLGPNTLRWLTEDVEAFVRKRRIGPNGRTAAIGANGTRAPRVRQDRRLKEVGRKVSE